MVEMEFDEVLIREVEMPKDAAKLAAMWQASDTQWPGTWSGGTEITPQMVTEWSEREGMLNVYVVETADKEKIVGYCSFNERQEEKGVGYVALLNVHPDYQKKSLARRLLQKSIERCQELGFHMVTLGTWSGNLKSVPLYKKTGFYWVPDTSVWMLNFIPSILSLPCTQSFFAKHNWYTTMQRELTQQEDDTRWEGMKVFIYHFEEDGEAVTVWADREALCITAVETDDFFVGAIASNIEPPKGMPTPFFWRVKNKTERSLIVSIIASGTEHMKVDYRKALQLQPGEEIELEADVAISLDAPEVKPHKRVPSLRSLFIIDGMVLELGTGMRPQPAISIATAPKHVTMMPAIDKNVLIQLHSYLQEDSEVSVRLTAPDGLRLDWIEQTLTVPAKSWAGVPVHLHAEEEGVYELKALVSFQGGKTAPETIPVFCMPVNGILAHKGKRHTRIENATVRLSIDMYGGGVAIHTAKDDTWLGTVSESVGPPFWPTEFRSKDFHINLEEKRGRIFATLSALSDTYPGIALERQIALGAGEIVEMHSGLANYGAESYDLQLSQTLYSGQGNINTLTVPLLHGYVQERQAVYPDAEEDISKKPHDFAERWVAVESPAGTLGLLWEDGIEENAIGWSFNLLTPKYHCEPQSRSLAGKLYVYAGYGTWRHVREFARRLSGEDSEQEVIPVETRPVHNAYFEPMPLVSVQDKLQTMLVVDNLRGKPLSGTLEIQNPLELGVDKGKCEFKSLSRTRDLREKITLNFPPNPAAYAIHLNLVTDVSDQCIELPAIRLGTEKPIEFGIEEALLHIDNGRSRFNISPGFTGAMTAWYMDGFNHLLSPFPEVKTFGWMSPWYGGITPIATTGDEEDFPGKLHHETLNAEHIEIQDTQGTRWSGVRLTGHLEREKLLGLDVMLDYLTVGDSNILKLVYHVINRTSAKRHLDIGWATYWQPDGTSAHNVLRGAGMQRKPNPWYTWAKTGNWAAVTNGQTGRTLALVSPYPQVRMMDWGDAGGHLGFWEGVHVPPMETLQRVAYCVLCDSVENAQRYAVLKDLK